MTNYREVNFDGLIGPTHNYAGLSPGNLASQTNANRVSNPKEAALQGLRKMKMLADDGYAQAFLPPQMRPRFDVLHALGFTGSEATVLEQVTKKAPHLLSMVYSASCMWTANAATVTPSPDASDNKVHFTPANLLTLSHRFLEAEQTYRILKQIFADQSHFVVHPSLPAHQRFGDEGAANHTRLCEAYGKRGHGLFVYGAHENETRRPAIFPARQTLMASEAVARSHRLEANNVSFLQQNPQAIDAGAFHNDVVAVGNGHFLFYHEEAYVKESLQSCFDQIRYHVPSLQTCGVPSNRVSLKDAIATYLFNSQLLAQPDGSLESMTLIAPVECAEHRGVAEYIQQLIAADDNPVSAVRYVDVRESMSNGGGPACLRLRVVLSEQELLRINATVMFSSQRYDDLASWVNRHYRDKLTPDDLGDPDFFSETQTAMHELARMLALNLG